ncbi:ABC transporter permease [Deinococcus deserti]|uniref:Putative ABC transporter, permease component n=1 Tax=Deinococcus deserti (strain DSM 17065 / CIP 109153 / LMG 22923 / VCD115) TaxID=546414 RepID=C1CUY9_DEIDV|nr:ABC transporter permease [Deinococcus deserti]ACO46006.1 putative ABC transporter, permease component [Deinococcus deserti VCD115]
MTTVPSNVPAVRSNKAQSQFGVAWRQFRKNRLAQIGGFLLTLMYLLAVFAPVVAPDGLSTYSTSNITRYHPPTPVHIRDPESGAFGRPFVYKYTQQLNMDTFVNEYKPSAEKCPIFFGVRGDSYRILGLIPGNIHLFGTGQENPDCNVYLFGGEALGRDLFTRTMYASQISLTIGVGAVLISTLIGLAMGSAAAFFGGFVDTVVMRLVEVIAAIPYLFLLILLRSVFPQDINPILALYMILGLLAFISWGGLARAVRGQLMSVREQDFVSAAQALGASNGRIMWRHMLPTMTTFVIVGLSLSIPGAILTESGLSFLGIGAVEPYVSWGSLLAQAQEGGLASINQRPWVLIPGFFIVFTVMCFQLLGDGLRDAFDPRKRQ